MTWIYTIKGQEIFPRAEKNQSSGILLVYLMKENNKVIVKKKKEKRILSFFPAVSNDEDRILEKWKKNQPNIKHIVWC